MDTPSLETLDAPGGVQALCTAFAHCRVTLGPAKGHPVDEPGRPCGQRGKGGFVQRAASGCILVIGAVIQKISSF